MTPDQQFRRNAKIILIARAFSDLSRDSCISHMMPRPGLTPASYMPLNTQAHRMGPSWWIQPASKCPIYDQVIRWSDTGRYWRSNRTLEHHPIEAETQWFVKQHALPLHVRVMEYGWPCSILSRFRMASIASFNITWQHGT